MCNFPTQKSYRWIDFLRWIEIFRNVLRCICDYFLSRRSTPMKKSEGVFGRLMRSVVCCDKFSNFFSQWYQCCIRNVSLCYQFFQYGIRFSVFKRCGILLCTSSIFTGLNLGLLILGSLVSFIVVVVGVVGRPDRPVKIKD